MIERLADWKGWNQLRNLDLAKIRKLLKSPILIDLRNLYEPNQVRGLGFFYKGVGPNWTVIYVFINNWILKFSRFCNWLVDK